MSDVNIELLRRGVEWVEQQDKLPPATREWLQTSWVANNDYRVRLYRHEPTCGTAYCLGGYIGQRVDPRYRDSDWVDDTHVSRVAEKALGITEYQGDSLFRAGNTAEDIRRIAEEIAGQEL